MSVGTIERSGERVTFRYERILRHPVDAVWRAIADPEAIEMWLGSRPEIDLRPGGRYITHHGTGERVVDRILRLEPPRLLEHTYWEHVNPSAVVRWEIGPAEEGCLLTLAHALSMDDVRSAAATVAQGDAATTILARNAAGWHRILDRLEAGLDGRDSPWSPEAQQALRDRYAAMLG